MNLTDIEQDVIRAQDLLEQERYVLAWGMLSRVLADLRTIQSEDRKPIEWVGNTLPLGQRREAASGATKHRSHAA